MRNVPEVTSATKRSSGVYVDHYNKPSSQPDYMPQNFHIGELALPDPGTSRDHTKAKEYARAMRLSHSDTETRHFYGLKMEIGARESEARIPTQGQCGHGRSWIRS